VDTKPGMNKENAIAKKMQIAEKSHIMMAILLLKRASLFPTQIHGCILMEVVALLKEDLNRNETSTNTIFWQTGLSDRVTHANEWLCFNGICVKKKSNSRRGVHAV
jgi:hypothetical protein